MSAFRGKTTINYSSAGSIHCQPDSRRGAWKKKLAGQTQSTQRICGTREVLGSDRLFTVAVFIAPLSPGDLQAVKTGMAN